MATIIGLLFMVLPVLCAVLVMHVHEYRTSRISFRRAMLALDANERLGLRSPQSFGAWRRARFAEGSDAIRLRRITMTEAADSARSVDELAFVSGHDSRTAAAIFNARRGD